MKISTKSKSGIEGNRNKLQPEGKGAGTHPLQDLTEDMVNMGPKGVLILQVHSTQLSHLSEPNVNNNNNVRAGSV
jgi:hypothetical protein